MSACAKPVSRLSTLTKLIFVRVEGLWEFLRTGGNTPIMSEDSRDVDIKENAAHTNKLGWQIFFLGICRKPQLHNNLWAGRRLWQGRLAGSQPKCGCVCTTSAWKVIFFCHLKLARETATSSSSSGSGVYSVQRSLLCNVPSVSYRKDVSDRLESHTSLPGTQSDLTTERSQGWSQGKHVRMKLWTHALIQPCACVFELSDDTMNSQCCFIDMRKS